MNPSCIVGFAVCLIDTMSTAMMMTLQPLILMMDIPLDMIQTDSPEGSSFDPTNPVTIQDQHQPLIEQYPHYQQYQPSAGYCFYSTPKSGKARGQATVA